MASIPFSPTNGSDHVKTSMKFGNQYGCGEQLNWRMFITLFSYFKMAAANNHCIYVNRCATVLYNSIKITDCNLKLQYKNYIKNTWSPSELKAMRNSLAWVAVHSTHNDHLQFQAAERTNLYYYIHLGSSVPKILWLKMENQLFDFFGTSDTWNHNQIDRASGSVSINYDARHQEFWELQLSAIFIGLCQSSHRSSFASELQTKLRKLPAEWK